MNMLEKQNKPSWARVLEVLRREGGMTAAQVGEALDMSSMGARQHLLRLEKDGSVGSRFEKRPTGRPALIFELTDNAAEHFPQAYDRLAVSILGELEEMHGREAVTELLDHRRTRLEKAYCERLNGTDDPFEKARIIAQIRDEEGHMAESFVDEEGCPAIIEHNCPIRSVAARYPEFCQMEEELFTNVIGAKIERVHHIAKGQYACVYRIGSNSNGKESL